MAAFKPVLRITQSIDGKTLTIHDDSDYANNDEHYVVTDFSVRQVVIYDANNILITTVVFAGNNLTIEYAITKDVYLRLLATFTLSAGGNKNSTTNWMSRQFYDLQQEANELGSSCGCGGNNSMCSDTTKAREAINAAVTDFIAGASVKCQSKLDDANTLILSAKPC